MNNPGDYPLFAGAIATALDRSTGAMTPLENLEGMLACSLDFDFKYGSGGATCSALVQRTPDKGTTWRDMCRIDFTTASRVVTRNIEGLLSKTTGDYTDLSVEGIYDGILSGTVRAVLIVGSTPYVNTSLAVWLNAR